MDLLNSTQNTLIYNMTKIIHLFITSADFVESMIDFVDSVADLVDSLRLLGSLLHQVLPTLI